VPDPEFDLRELCGRGKVTPRTVHFYVQQGLLPPAGAPGPGARYGDGHLARLRLIRLLQKEHLPLAEIGKRMKGLSDSQVQELVVEARVRREANRGSALDYIRGVLGGDGTVRALATHAVGSVPPSETVREDGEDFDALRTPPPASVAERSQWERFTLADGLELHVQRPMPRLQQRRLDRLLAAARDIFATEEEE
jgi:DNA-binding transcriptional MerR regulator